MASRTVAIRIIIDNREAINNARAQEIAMRAMNAETDRHTHLQNGLTSSFIKGNLAARAISAGYLAIRDSLRLSIGEAIAFEHNMTKIAAITETGGASLRSLEGTIRSLSLATNQNQNELAKTALEMGKMGLTGPQVEEALGGVARLARALDEDLVRTGETVVAVMNAYGFSTSEAGKITDQLAFTVKASALSIETFGTAFSYVGGTAKAAGVDFLELQGSMDVLSNAGIKASTIGTQLRRVIADLSDPSSKAGKAIGGQTIETLGLVGALQALREKNIDIAGLTEIFGRTASSVSSILIRYSDVIGDLAQKTGEATGVTQGMSDQMNLTFKSALDGITTAWIDLGIEISKSTGFLATFARTAKDTLEMVGQGMNINRRIDAFKQAKPEEYNRIQRGDGGMFDFRLPRQRVMEDSFFQNWSAQADQAEADLKRKENAVSELKELISKDMVLPKNFNPSTQLDMIKIAPENTYMYNYIRKLFGTDDKGFEAAVKRAKIEWALKAERVSGEEFDTGLLKPGKTPKPKAHSMNEASKRMLGYAAMLDPMSHENLTDYVSEGTGKGPNGEARKNDMTGQVSKAWKEYNTDIAVAKRMTENFATALIGMKAAADGVNGSIDILSYYFVEGVFSDKKDPFKGISDAFGNFAKKMAADIVALSLKILFFKGLMSLIGFAGGGPAVSGFAKTLAGSMVPGLKFATGTDQVVRSPTMFMAGEAGAERVRVTPRAKMNEGSGEGSVTYIIQGDVYDYDRFQRKVKQAESSNRKAFV